jgi:3-methylcrotonyl-CoA carboxylase alpha subunit
MANSGVPVLPGYDGADQSLATLQAEVARLGLPVLIKPTAGGGGKGMRIVREATQFEEAVSGARREAAKSFGDDRLLLERFVETGRHVEIQVFADAHGHAVHLFERDCSLQRRHQKVIEEAPAPDLPEPTRRAMGDAAVAAARAVGYEGAGTVEFLYDGREFYFLEMNTRLQVEHPVTEMITGLDLVEWQLRVAAGEPLPLAQEQIARRGHAVEARLYAEDAERGFLPATGTIRELSWPETSDELRIDTGVSAGDAVTVHYDPMLAKVICWAPDRTQAFARLRAALERVDIVGLKTNARFLWDILGDERVLKGDVSTRYLEQRPAADGASLERERNVAWIVGAACVLEPIARASLGASATSPASPWESHNGFRLGSAPVVLLALQHHDERHLLSARRVPDGWRIEIDGHPHHIENVRGDSNTLTARVDGQPVTAHVSGGNGAATVGIRCVRYEFVEDSGAEQHASAEHEGHLRAPMPGHVLEVRAAAGQRVATGAVLVVLEAMKMEHSLVAPWAGTVESVSVASGARVEEGTELVRLVPDPAPDSGTANPRA